MIFRRLQCAQSHRSDEMNKFFAISEELVDVTGIEPVTPCLQRGRSKTLNGFIGVAHTENQRSSRFSDVPKLYQPRNVKTSHEARSPAFCRSPHVTYNGWMQTMNSERQFKIVDKIQANLHGRVIDATVRTVVEYTHGIKLQVDFGRDETALVELRQVLK
jgi:hypothetical protein